MEYSKGEWSIIEGSKRGSLHIIRTLPNGGVDRICEIVIPSTGYRVNSEANAHLIAASPRMYEFIKKRADEGDIEARQLIETLSGEEKLERSSK